MGLTAEQAELRRLRERNEGLRKTVSQAYKKIDGLQGRIRAFEAEIEHKKHKLDVAHEYIEDLKRERHESKDG